jgi:hypothetical protein
MNARHAHCLLLTLILTLQASPSPAQETRRPIPEPLQQWEGWTLWDGDPRACPSPYDEPQSRICIWPSWLRLDAAPDGAVFSLGARVYQESWLKLPGDDRVWPSAVTANGEPVPVLQRDNAPAIKLPPGVYEIRGTLPWADMPQRITLPREIGLLTLTLAGQPVETPSWQNDGTLWLRRDAPEEETTREFLSTKMYGVLEDGIPVRLRLEIELIVSGPSREVILGAVLPQEWRVSGLKSQIPAAIDDNGVLKAQVRAGRWTISVEAFHLHNPSEIAFPSQNPPAANELLLAFQAAPEVRMVELEGALQVDASQTTIPSQWAHLPVYRWDTEENLRIQERTRGMGEQKPSGLSISRELWLDEDGGGFTVRDSLTGNSLVLWRLDAAEGLELGSVRSPEGGQLITRNPASDAAGVEVRSRKLHLTATGRMPETKTIPATGWQTTAENLSILMHLPPGWRLLAAFGADEVHGDWLTNWTLLDLFLLLLFTVAMFRLYGFAGGIAAFLAFSLAYHEPEAPRYTWLALLVPVALLRVVTNETGRRWLGVVKWIAAAALLLAAIPFVVNQVEQALYPQLERVTYSDFSDFSETYEGPAMAPAPGEQQQRFYGKASSSAAVKDDAAIGASKQNLWYDSKARIQTGPGIPHWQWRRVNFTWNGPVAPDQTIQPVFISRTAERLLSFLRVALFVALGAMLFRREKSGAAPAIRGGTIGTAVIVALSLFTLPTARAAEIPDKETLDLLRQRLLEPADAFPHAADIPQASLHLTGNVIRVEMELHAAAHVAVPLPGKLPGWAPLSVALDGEPQPSLRRNDGSLWIAVVPGIHRVTVTGAIPAHDEWEWGFELPPRKITVDAPGWNVTGLRADGKPLGPLFFKREQKSDQVVSTYEQQNFQPVVTVRRSVELGLVWRLKTTVERVSEAQGAGVSLRIPMLEGERVVTGDAVVRDGTVEVMLPAEAKTVSWESELEIAPRLSLGTRTSDTWVEQWEVSASPVWSLALEGLPPVFEQGSVELRPTWRPWPGESATLSISQPEFIPGATVTVLSGQHETRIGKRQKTSTLKLELRCSLSQDFLVSLPAHAEVTQLTVADRNVPVRRNGDKIIVPLQPGDQTAVLSWSTPTELGFIATPDEIQLPVEGTNITTSMDVPADRWILWTEGPLRGPAVRFWPLLVCAVGAGLVLTKIRNTPLGWISWTLLAVGLTQVHVLPGLVVLGWILLLRWRGQSRFTAVGNAAANILQIILVILTMIVLAILMTAVSRGLLGTPEMFIAGNGSFEGQLIWDKARTGGMLPQPSAATISIWWYRLLMLAWALWLSFALVKWLRWAWLQFSSGGCWRGVRKPHEPTPPPLPPEAAGKA